MNEEIKLNDVADTLLIVDKRTVDKLFQMDDPIGCVGLYLFYYKTAKWQKTNRVKANDIYAKKCLKIGSDKLRKLKNALKESGLIKPIQVKKNGKIKGHFIEVSYLVSKSKEDKLSDNHNTQNHNTQIPLVGNSTSGKQDTNALKEIIKCLKKENEMLKKESSQKQKEKIEILQFGEKVKLPLPAYQKLCSEFGEMVIVEYIEKINNYLTTTENGLKKGGYKNYAQTIRNWINSDDSRSQQPASVASSDKQTANVINPQAMATWKDKARYLANGKYVAGGWGAESGEENYQWAKRVNAWLSVGLQNWWDRDNHCWTFTEQTKAQWLALHKKADSLMGVAA